MTMEERQAFEHFGLDFVVRAGSEAGKPGSVRHMDHIEILKKDMLLGTAQYCHSSGDVAITWQNPERDKEVIASVQLPLRYAILAGSVKTTKYRAR